MPDTITQSDLQSAHPGLLTRWVDNNHGADSWLMLGTVICGVVMRTPDRRTWRIFGPQMRDEWKELYWSKEQAQAALLEHFCSRIAKEAA
jgi:hypothetical protein